MSPKTPKYQFGQSQAGKMIKDIIDRVLQSEMEHVLRQALIAKYQDDKPEGK